MRIVISNASAKWGGLHEVTETLTRGLSGRGHEIMILANPAGVLAERMRQIAEVETVLGGMDLSPLTITRVRRALKRWHADVVLMMSKKDVRVSGPAAWMYGAPYIIRYANDRPLNRMYDWLLFGRLPAGQIANSKATRETLIKSAPWLSEKSVTVIYNGIDAARFNVERAALGLPAGGIVFGFVGRIERRKGIIDLMGAWSTVAESVGNAHLVIVGKGPDENEAKAILGEHARVHWLGFRTDIPAVMQSFDIAVLPSHWEGFGLVALEALAAGKPVIATAASSLPEIVEHNLHGLLVPPRDSGRLARAMIELAVNRDLRERLGRAGYERARTRFTIDHMIDRYEELLTSVVVPR